MPYDFHNDKDRYFSFQYEHSRDYIVPAVNQYISSGMVQRVMEVGSAEAGVLKAFLEKGCHCVGVEISDDRVVLARKYFEEELAEGKIEFHVSDIFNVDPRALNGGFDLIILKDVIEHIHDQDKALAHLRKFLKPGGMIFFTMPPWNMPFGGHQQLLKHRTFHKTPWIHLLPRKVYGSFLRRIGESQATIDLMLETHDTGISIRRFEGILKRNKFEVLSRDLWFFNPTYKYKFGLKPRRILWPLSRIPILRDFWTTSVYYLVRRVD